MPKLGYKQTKEHIKKRNKHLKGNTYSKGYKWTKIQKETLCRDGENAPNYIDGRWSGKHYCITCEKEIGNQGSKRCYSCSNSIQLKKNWKNTEFRKSKSGKNCNLYKDGRTLKNYYCIGCGKKVTGQFYKRCHSCDTKLHWENGDMDGVFTSPTKPEKIIMKTLDRLKIKYIFQHRPKGYSKPYDFYISNKNLLIEFDGIYWHNLPGSKERDEEKTRYALQNGYHLLRFNESNLNDFEKTIIEIRNTN